MVVFNKNGNSTTGTAVNGQSKTYNATDLCFLNGVFIDPGYIHDVLLTGLEPSTTYYYSCGVKGVSLSYLLNFQNSSFAEPTCLIAFSNQSEH